MLSPYASPDSSSGNHLLIDLKKLDKENILSSEDWISINNKDKKEFIKNKERLLEKIYISQGEEDSFRDFLQKVFLKQYLELKDYANNKGIVIFGDLPFYVNLDSKDVSENKNYFLLDDNG